jgi:hypothetical protein
VAEGASVIADMEVGDGRIVEAAWSARIVEDAASGVRDVETLSGMEAMLDSSVGMENAAPLVGDVEAFSGGVITMLSSAEVVSKD